MGQDGFVERKYLSVLTASLLYRDAGVEAGGLGILREGMVSGGWAFFSLGGAGVRVGVRSREGYAET